jgi:hypothetical protein
MHLGKKQHDGQQREMRDRRRCHVRSYDLSQLHRD